ncbi:VirB4 family type IV secretion/conjugal transfer ATPase [Succinatimonas hippei]|uniref:Type IV secretion/conjugal transfer ATPase, VirB4 family n=1 Tax=Succinatimonas hippei (strain DSM 22608 / JCM 16073 / KCTC 15190 / YIT 12066) TaxID=762983 RepID=E8LKH0_SUCHY|nr:type IV secretion/conjugal transfer ATPase VirB4 family [Succinatimonas hippei]EFY06957.1 type IV secretion/conjugal transfer ATPase, VirB4 family [Succinatimonas hippei YIT 12066]
MSTDLLFYTALILSILAILSILPFAWVFTRTFSRKSTAPAFCDLLDYATLAEENIIVLKSGGLCAFYELFPEDQSQQDLSALSHFEDVVQKAFLKLGDNWAVHFDVCRINDGFYAPKSASCNQTIQDLENGRSQKFKTEKSFESRFFLTLTFLGTSVSRRKLEKLVLSDGAKTKDAKQETSDLIEKFKNDCKSITDTLSLVIKIKALASRKNLNFTLNESLSFIHSCITGKNHDIAVPRHSCYLDALLSTKDFKSGFTPCIGEKHIACIAIDGFPQTAYLGILNSLALLPFPYRFNTRFLAFDQMQSHLMLEKYRRLWSQKSRGILSQIFNQQSSRVNEYAVEKVSEIDEAKFAFEGNEEIFGAYTSVLIIMDENLDSLQDKASLAVKTVEDLGFAARVETVNAVESYLGSLPGHCFENVRRPIVSGTVFTDLIPLSTPWNGERFSPNPLYGEHASPLMQVKSEGHSRFFLNLHQKDLGNTVVVGPPGAGKSVLLGELILNLMRYKNMKIFAFDKGYSFYALTKALAGSHIEFSNLKSAFCPLYSLENSADFTYAQSFIELLCRMSGYTLSLTDREEITDGLKILSKRDNSQRSLTDLHLLLLSKSLKQAIAPYTVISNENNLLDGTENCGFDSDLTVFECSDLFEAPKSFSLPVLKHIFKLIADCFSGEPRAIILDEAWLMLKDEIFASELLKWFKTLRKHNVIVILATQSITDIAKSSLFETFLECVKTRIYLPNYDAKGDVLKPIYKQTGLNDEQITRLSDAIPKKDYLLLKGQQAAFFNLMLTEDELRLLSFSGDHIKKHVNELFAVFGRNFYKHQEI